MGTIPTSSIDLNLLSVLDVVLRERSVRRAAASLGVTPSAVSHALRRLRRHVGDPLVVRTAKGMVATVRGERLAGPLERALAELRATVLVEALFDPSTARRVFTISSADLSQFILLPELCRTVRRAAPGIGIVIRSPQRDPFEGLAKGALDLAFGIFDAAPEGFRYQALFRESFTCVVRRGHPVTRGAFTLKSYLALEHVSVAPRGSTGSLVDSALAKLGQKRTVALVVPHFLVAPLIVAETDLALMISTRVALRYAELLPLELLSPPLPLERFTIAQIWHERAHRDPGHVWLRQAIGRVAQDISPPAGP